MSNGGGLFCWCQVQPRVGQRGAVTERGRVLPRLRQLCRVAALQPVSVHRHRRLLLVSQLRGGVSVVSQRDVSVVRVNQQRGVSVASQCGASVRRKSRWRISQCGVGMTFRACRCGCVARWGCNNIYFVDGGYTERNVNPLMSTRSSVMVNFYVSTLR